jgi:Fe2+ or Zn2+ uptake regulation protein
MTTQTKQLNRVASSASEAIQTFIAARLANTDENGAAFTADQLRSYVNDNVKGGVSPSSADRVLRMLRQKGLVDYVVLNRGKSLYRAKPVVTVPPVVSDTN